MRLQYARAMCASPIWRAPYRFYEALLERPVKERDETYSVFEAGGFRLGLFAFRLAGEEHAYGTNCLPRLELPCRAALVQKLAGQRVVFPLRRIGPNWVSEIEDSEGNRLELTAPAQEEAEGKSAGVQMDIHAYWRAALRQDAAAMRPWFRQDAAIYWHNTNERFSLQEFLRANCEYPGAWDGRVERVEQAGRCIITAVHVWARNNPSLSFHVASFFQLCEGKIARLDEYWGDDGPAPAWQAGKTDRHADTLTKIQNRSLHPHAKDTKIGHRAALSRIRGEGRARPPRRQTRRRPFYGK